MMKTIVGLYSQAKDGNAAIESLVQAGFSRQSLTMLGNVQAMWHYLGCRPAKLVAQDFGIGALWGLALYAFFGAIVAVGETLLGFDRNVALAALLTFMLIGGLVGGLMGLFFGLGNSEQENRTFLRGLRRGGVILAVRTADEHTPRAHDILQATGGQDVHICSHHGQDARRQTEEQLEAPQNLLMWWMRLGARGLGLALLMLLWSFLDRASMNGGVMTGILTKGITEDILLVTLIMTILGVLMALRWEGLGGLIIVSSVLLFEGIKVIATRQLQFGMIDIGFLAVGLLFLVLWLYSNFHMRDNLFDQTASHQV